MKIKQCGANKNENDRKGKRSNTGKDERGREKAERESQGAGGK